MPTDERSGVATGMQGTFIQTGWVNNQCTLLIVDTSQFHGTCIHVSQCSALLAFVYSQKVCGKTCHCSIERVVAQRLDQNTQAACTAAAIFFFYWKISYRTLLRESLRFIQVSCTNEFHLSLIKQIKQIKFIISLEDLHLCTDFYAFFESFKLTASF